MIQDRPLWMPHSERNDGAALSAFREAFQNKLGMQFADYDEFHRASIREREIFWSLVWDQCGIIGDKGERVLARDTMPGAEFFPDAKLNFYRSYRSYRSGIVKDSHICSFLSIFRLFSPKIPCSFPRNRHLSTGVKKILSDAFGPKVMPTGNPHPSLDFR